ncbi:actin-like [Pieris brassicae]|nr:actin-like [Pieris brassicae]
MAFEKPAIVLDNGSYIMKAGFACDNHPVSMFRTLVGRPSYLHGSYGREPYDVFIGDDAIAKIDDLELTSPIVNGKIIHWDNMERIWHHVFYRELKAAPEDRAVMLACGNSSTIDEKIKCCEVFFEVLNSPALCIQSQSVLSMYGSGFTTGICVDIGHDTTDISPVFEGGQIKYAHIQTGLAGVQISNYIKRSLLERDLADAIKSPTDIDSILRELYITRDAAMPSSCYERRLNSPCGDIELCNEAFMAGEMLFQPDVIMEKKTNYLPLHDAVVTASMKCDSEISSELYEAIVPCGGLAMIPGLNARLQTELEEQLNRPVNILSSPEAYSISWLGGATFAGLPDAKKMWVTQKQYEEYGVKIIKNKFM